MKVFWIKKKIEKKKKIFKQGSQIKIKFEKKNRIK